MPSIKRFVRRILGLVVLMTSSGLLFWGSWPLQIHSESVSIPPRLRLVLEWPLTTRIGDKQSVRMQIDPGPTGQSKIASAAPQVDAASNEMAAARLEFAGLQFYPGEQVSQPLRPGVPLTFHWQYRPETEGDYNGVAWLYILSVPARGGLETLTPVLASEIRIHAIDLFGLSGPAARILGASGVLIGGLLGLDGALVWLKKRALRQPGLQPVPEFTEE